MELDATFICAYCFQVNAIVVDGSGGPKQEYIEDCEICCRPNKLNITVDDNMEKATVQAEMP